MKKLRNTLLLLLTGLLLASLLASCGLVTGLSPTTNPAFSMSAWSTPFASRPELSAFPDLSTVLPADTDGQSGITAAPSETSAESPVNTTQVPATTAAPQPPEPAYPSFDNLVDLGDYLFECKENDELTVIFRYSGDRNTMWDQNFADLLCAFYTWISTYGGKQDTYQLKITEYPGDRMLDAYRSGDRSALSDDEKEALNVAETVVANAKNESDSDLELERLLHDWICDNVIYDTTGTGVPDHTDPPRHLTAVGALLDGSVNCQGYTDAFYLLASMAGFTVSRQSGMTSSGGHMFNTILLGGEWYIVDVCHDDTSMDSSGKGISDYRYLNAGRDLCKHEWSEEQELHPISADSGSEYYYYLTEDGYERTFATLDEMAECITEQWFYNGETEFYLMLTDQNADWSDLSACLSEDLNAAGRAYNYTIWSSWQDVHTYFYVVFK